MDKVYNRINWVNRSESATTPLDKINLNKMDYSLNEIDDRVVEQNKEIKNVVVDVEDVLEEIKNIEVSVDNLKKGVTTEENYSIKTELNLDLTATERVQIKCNDSGADIEPTIQMDQHGMSLQSEHWSINKNGEAKFKTLNGFNPDYFLIRNTATGDKIEINDGIPSFNGSVYSLKMEGKCDQWGPGTPIVPIKDPFIYALSDIVYYNDLKLKRGTDLESLVVVLEPGNYKIITNVCENPDSPNHVYAVTGTIRSTNPVDIVYREKIVSTDEHGCIAIAFDNPGRYEMWNGHYFICAVKAEDAFMGSISNFIELGSAGDVKDELYLYPDRSYRLIKRVKHIVPSDYNIDFKEHPEAFILPQPMIEEGTFAGLAGLNFVGECTVFNSGLTNMEVTYYADLKKYIDSHSGGKSVNTIPTLILAKEV